MNKIPQNTKAQRGRPKDLEKTELILKAGTKLFMNKGLKGTSMDAVAKEAGVSKQTLYSHFKDKDDLFRSVIRRKIDAYIFMQTPFVSSGNLEHDLNDIGYHLLELILDNEALLLFRTVIAEGKNYKKTAQLFYEQGPEEVICQLENFFNSENIPDANFYAYTFIHMLEREWHTKMLIGLQKKPTQDEIKAHVRKVSANFMKIIA